MPSGSATPSASAPILLRIRAFISPSQLQESHSEPFGVAGTKRKKQLRGASLRFISLDGESPIGGSRVVGKISYAATLTGTARLHREFPTDYKPGPGEKGARRPSAKKRFYRADRQV